MNHEIQFDQKNDTQIDEYPVVTSSVVVGELARFADITL